MALFLFWKNKNNKPHLKNLSDKNYMKTEDNVKHVCFIDLVGWDWGPCLIQIILPTMYAPSETRTNNIDSIKLKVPSIVVGNSVA